MKTFKIVFAVCFLLANSLQLLAQPGGGGRLSGERKEKIEAMKIAFLTKRLDLSSEEAQKFWPVYNQMTKEIQTIRKDRRSDLRESREEFDKLSDKETEILVDQEFLFRQKELDVLKKYNAQFKQVLPIKKVAMLYRTEEDFKRHLLNEIRNKGANKPLE